MYKSIIKPLSDFVLSLTALLILSPLFLIIAGCLFFFNQGAGVFFTQNRPGKNNKIFKLVKFKTMTDKKDKDGTLLPDKDRLTRFGRFLRSSSLDEIPQLLNVMKGDMSLIGPRPFWSNIFRYTMLSRHADTKFVRVLPVGHRLTDVMLLVGKINSSWMSGMLIT
jgi:lipopolysaccharide/colanic/teichoic acid biosynthesis glycosyltransferase